jgi:signal transduction histidine kinase/CheY-like chemotaxis protein/HPt (histidine-containing phosphotransfer) domain-containing protein
MASDKEVVISSPYLTTGGGAVCSIMVKTYDLDDKPLGMVGVDYSLDSLTGDLGARQILDTGYIVVLDNSGNVIVDGHHPEYVQMEQEEYPESRRLIAESENTSMHNVGERGIEEYIVAYKMESLGWTLAVIFDEVEVLASSHTLLTAILVVSVAAFAFALLAGILIARSIVRPIEALTEASSIISGGEYEQSDELRRSLSEKLNVTGQGESKRLAKSLNMMVDTLQQRIEDARAADNAKSEFLASMSHEIRTPLNAINGLAELELRKELPKDTRSNIEKIYHSGVTLLNIINDILDISKIESGRFELLPVEYETVSIISDTASMNIIRIGSKSIDFRLEVDEDLPSRLYGDELRLKQILSNLLSNAIKYTERGAVELHVSCERTGEDGLFTFDVVDSGIGVTPENLEKIFAEYQQVDMKSHRGVEGTGLGLSISKRLAEMMGGTITAVSEYGRGSTFSLHIPQRIIDSSPIGKANVENLKSFRFFEGRACGLKNVEYTPMPYGKVLVVDDVPTNLDVAKGMLSAYDLEIHCVNSGSQAVALIRGEDPRFNLIFMDHMMPGMDGIEATRIIREEIGSEYAKTVPIVALTANAIIGADKMFLRNGFQTYLTKPIDVVKLDEILHEWLRDRQDEETLRRAESPGPEETQVEISGGGSASAPEEKPTEAPMRDPGQSLSILLEETRIDGVDLESGVRRFGNKAEMYLKIISTFVETMPSLLDKLRTVTAEGLPDYAIVVHGVKGSCYGIGADKVGKMAEALEFAAKKGDLRQVREENPAFMEEAETLLSRLADLLEKAKTSRTRSKA